jgi:hypothetical protein
MTSSGIEPETLRLVASASTNYTTDISTAYIESVT